MNRRMGLARGLTLIALVVLLALGGLYLLEATAPKANDPPATTLERVDMPHYDVYRFTDMDGRVTCWLYKEGIRAAGISCIATESIQRIKE